MECVGFSVKEGDWFADDPSEPAHIITAQMVRTLPVGRFIEETRRDKAETAGVVADYLQREAPNIQARDTRIDGNEQHYREVAELLRERSRRFKATAGGRPRMWGDDHYREVAEVYAAAWRSGPSPTKSVERQFQVSHSTAARWVHECRKRGFLGPTEKRRAGGVLLPEQEEGE